MTSRATLRGLVFVVLAAACAEPAQPAAGPAVPSLRLPHLVTPEHYALTVTPDLAAATFAGEATIDVNVLEQTSRIVLHAAEITFGPVTIEAAGATQTAAVTLDAATETATLAVGRPLRPGPARLSISYRGILNRRLRGLYLSEANGRRYAVTQLEATDARRMFPGFDEPAFKATFDLTAVIDRGDHAISNGVVVSDTPGPGAGTHTVKFATSPKMSSYLVALVVGDFECENGAADGIPIRVCATPDKKPLTRMALGDAEDLMRFYNKYFSIKYPFGKLDIVAVPDFAAGAMENTGAIFYRESSLLADEARASVVNRKYIMGILAHEMAHHWFGNLVTMDWWNDIWLNEGFATWMETKPVKALKPEWRVELDETRENLEAMAVDRLEATRPIRNAAETPRQISEAFDAIAYSKGAAILRMVEAWVGEEQFREAINAYLAKYQYGNAKAEDFWTTVASVTGKPVDRVMASFVTQPGVPLLDVRSHCEGAATTVTLAQSRYRELRQSPESGPRGGTALPATSGWAIPVCTRGANASLEGSCHVLAAPVETFSLPGCRPWVVANANGTGYYRAAYDPPLFDRILQNVASLNGRERVMLASDTWAAVRAGQQQVGGFLRVAEALKGDRTSAVMGVIGSGVGFTGRYLAAGPTKSRYEAWVIQTFAPALVQLGWTPAAGESDDVRALRASLVQIVGQVGGDAGVRAQARDLAVREVRQRGSVDPTLAPVVTNLAANGGDAALYDQFLSAYQSARTPEDQRRYLLSLGSFKAPALVRRTVEFALTPGVRAQDLGRLLAVVLSSEEGLEHAWPLVRDRWDELTKRIDPAFGMTNLITGLGSACDPQMANELRTFFQSHPAEGAERTLQQTIESIESCATLRGAQSSKLDAFLGR